VRLYGAAPGQLSDVRVMMVLLWEVQGIAESKERFRKDSNVYLAMRRAVNNWEPVQYLCRDLYIAEGFSG
jgi:hypothetical protein